MTDLAVENVPGESTAPTRAGVYPWYVVLLLGTGQILGSIDRNLVAILAEPIRHQFNLSDSQLGMLTGLAFAVSFAVVGIPMGLLIDRVVRVRLYAVLLAAWSLLTMVSGFAGSFAHLVLARAGVGAAESGSTPTAMALIADYFPPERRSSAIGWFFFSTPVGVALGFGVGGWIAGNLDWRSAFYFAAAPGLALCVLMWLTVREPRRGQFDAAPLPVAPGSSNEVARASLPAALAVIWRLRPMAYIAIGIGVLLAAHSGLTVFLGSYLIRVEGMSLPQTGAIIAFGLGVGGAIGMPLGGTIADRLEGRGVGRSLDCAALSMIGATGSMIAMLVAGGHGIVWFAIWLTIYAFFNAVYYGAAFGKYLSLPPAAVRGTCNAILIIIANLAGYGMGPQLTGILSDLAAGAGAAVPLRVAMVITAVVFLPAGLLFRMAAQRVRLASSTVAPTS